MRRFHILRRNEDATANEPAAGERATSARKPKRATAQFFR